MTNVLGSVNADVLHPMFGAYRDDEAAERETQHHDEPETPAGNESGTDENVDAGQGDGMERAAEEAGAELLDKVRAAVKRYVVLPDEESADAVALWIAATHAVPAWEHATRLGITAPEKRCGKTRLLDVVEALVYRPLVAFNATVAAIYRSIDADDPATLLFDEYDAIFGSKRAAENNEDLRALLNAGHGRGKPVLRCVGPNLDVKAFPSFAMVALAGIGDLPETVADRAVIIRMRRRAANEKVQPFRIRRDVPELHALRDALTAWALTARTDKSGHYAARSAAGPELAGRLIVRERVTGQAPPFCGDCGLVHAVDEEDP